MAGKGTVYAKQQLEIVHTHEEKPYGTFGKTLLPIEAKNLSLPEGDPLCDKPLRYVIFNQDLKTFIQGLLPTTRFLVDIEERERPETEYGPDRNIIQIYQDGKPVSVKKSSGYGKSPEIVRLEHELDLELEAMKRRSIEGQTAVAQVGNVLTSQIPIAGEDLGINQEGFTRVLGKYWQAMESSLDNYLAATPKRDPLSQEKQQEAQKAAVVSNNKPQTVIKHVGDLFTRAQKLDPPILRADLIVALSVNDPSEITDLEAAWNLAQKMSASARAT